MGWIIVLLLVVSAVVLLLTTWLYGHVQIGSADKTVWDLMDVLGAPLAAATLAAVISVIARSADHRAEAQREIDQERARETTLRAYLDRMTDLIVEQKLLESDEGAAVRAVGHAHTFAALRSLNGPRKGILLRFLQDASLITKSRPVISLELADLTDADLDGADLSRTNLRGANLREADLFGADLQDADLREAVVSEEQLAGAENLVGAMMPDGTTMTEERWTEFRNSI